LTDFYGSPARAALTGSLGNGIIASSIGATLEDAGFDKRVKLAAVDHLVHQAVTLTPILQDATLLTA